MPHSTTPTTKFCSKCGEEKPLSEFGLKNDSADGLRSHCKACRAEESRAYYVDNRERETERARAWQKANPEKVAESRRAYYAANRERVNETKRAYRAANRERAAERDRAYYEANRERKAKASRAWENANPEKVAAQAARTRAKHPDQYAARNAVNNAVRRGEFPPARDLPCASCGAPAQEFHHYLGYSPEHWLDVVAVCRTCHVKLDREQA